MDNYKWRRNNPEKYAESARKSSKKQREKKRAIVFNHYGNECKFCNGTKNLQIDHINNDGKEFREKECKCNFYHWIIKNEFPKDLQTLCKSCNMTKSNKFRVGINWTGHTNKHLEVKE